MSDLIFTGETISGTLFVDLFRAVKNVAGVKVLFQGFEVNQANSHCSLISRGPSKEVGSTLKSRVCVQILTNASLTAAYKVKNVNMRQRCFSSCFAPFIR
jgi:hypothetical protein